MSRLVFEQPALLLLLPLCLTLAWWIEQRTKTRLMPGRWRAVRALRWAAITVLVLALAGLAAERPEDRLTVIFAVDGSRSVGGPRGDEIVRFLGEAGQHRPRSDLGGVVVFGGEAMVDRFPDDGFRGGEVAARPNPDATDLEAAVRLARGLFPAGHEKRLVLLTDGVETQGSIEEAIAAASPDLDVAWLELASPDLPEALIEQISTPERVVAGQPHRVRVAVQASREMNATLRLYRGSVPVAATPVRLEPGTSPQIFAFDQIAPPDSGAILYRARLEAEDDGSPENNRAAALVRVEGRPSALLIDSDPAALAPLAATLNDAGFGTDVGGPGALPGSLQGLAAYDTVVLSDVAATHFSSAQLENLATWVRDLGGGLSMLGGPDSFGPGGYWRTPIEEVLPLSMEVKDRSYLPSVGLVLCIDKSGSMAGHRGESKIEVAKAAAVAVAELLEPMDQLGVIGFDAAAKWIVPMTSGSEIESIRSRLGSLRAGGGTDAYPALELASQVLATSETRVKHVLLVTDGQLSARDHEGLVAEMSAAGITVSTVAVGTDADVYTLERIARVGDGSFYHSYDADRIPRIFLREAFRVARSWVVEEPFQPVRRGGHPALRGFDSGAAPPLLGYVAASEKPGAEHPLTTPRGDPLLSLWRVGLGKAVAFTSDAKGRWAGRWLGWPGYEPFWASVVRYSVRDPASGRLRASASVVDGRLRLAADFLDERGAFVHGAQMRARVVGPDGRTSEIELMQEGPGRYEGEIEATAEGPYLAAVAAEDDAEAATAMTVVPYAQEFRGLSRAPVGLERLVASGRVRRLDGAEDVFLHRGTGGAVRWPLAPWLLVAAAALLVLEVAARKAAIPDWLRRSASKPATEPAVEPRFEALQTARRRAVRPRVPSVEPAIVADEGTKTEPSAEVEREPLTATPTSPEPAGASAYTSRLLEAKRRLARRG